MPESLIQYSSHHCNSFTIRLHVDIIKRMDVVNCWFVQSWVAFNQYSIEGVKNFVDDPVVQNYFHNTVVWVRNMSCTNKLHMLHDRIMRLICSTSSGNAIILQKEQKWLTCGERIKYHTAQLVFKTNCLPNYMNAFTSISNKSVYGLRSIARNELNIPKSRTHYMK